MSELEYKEACTELGDHHAFLHREVHRAHEQIVELRQKIAKYESAMKFVLKCHGVGTAPQVYFAMERMQGALEGETGEIV